MQQIKRSFLLLIKRGGFVLSKEDRQKQEREEHIERGALLLKGRILEQKRERKTHKKRT